jgi:MFS family permease
LTAPTVPTDTRTPAMPTTVPARSTAGPDRSAALRAVARRPAVRGWVLAVTVYFLAVFHRSSLAVAGILAEQRFGITASQLGAFVLLQIGVYAAMQVPTGVLVDRYGPRRLLVVASSLMGVGQLLFAVAPSYPTALVARGLLGCGDAMTFVSVLRFAAASFSPRRYPVLVAVTGTIGTAGNVLATLPLAVLLRRVGWSAGFAAAGSLSLVAAVAVWLLLDDRAVRPRPLRRADEIRAGLVAVTHRVVGAWLLPGTRLGFWVHFACMSTSTSFGVLWGHPYLVDAAGFGDSAASAILMGGVLLSAVAGPVVGWSIGRWWRHRVALGLSVCAVTVVGWSVTVVGFGDRPPQTYVAVLFVLTMLGGPASMIAFAVARDYNDPRVIGTASGVVNVGGFLATAVIAMLFGWTVTAVSGPDAHGLRMALLVPIAVQVFGMYRAVVWRRRVRATARKPLPAKG